MAHMGAIGKISASLGRSRATIVTLATPPAGKLAKCAFRPFVQAARWQTPPHGKPTNSARREILAWWLEDITTIHRASRRGSLSGVVRLEGVPQPGQLVNLIYTNTGQIINTMKTNALGAFRFDGLDQAAAVYMVIAKSDTLNAQVFDHLTPSVH